jgi:DNA-binding NtrC family response regulator
MADILICDDDSTFQLATKLVLTKQAGHRCHTAKNTDEAWVILKKQKIDILLLDIEMRTREEGLEFLPRVRELDPDLPIIMSSGRTDLESVRRALRAGAWDYSPKDASPDDLLHSVLQALQHLKDRREVSLSQAEIRRSARHDSILGDSEPARRLRSMLQKFSRSDAPVLIYGETGTGKELAARSLRPIRADGSLAPFVAVDSATIQGTMAESILFGHEKGAFTGAEKTVRGLFEEADGGVVFFDELANMPLAIQQKLLRVIQEKEVVRLGSHRPIPVQFRVICASNQDLEKLVNEGRFQADLYQRLNVLPLRLPSLAERREDIPLLAIEFLKRAQPSWSFSDEAIQSLTHYSWPGNIRELQNVISYAVTMADGPELDVGDLPERLRAGVPLTLSAAEPGLALDGGFYAQVLAHEAKLLKSALETPYRSVSELAERLGMDRSHLYTKLKQHGLKPPRRAE